MRASPPFQVALRRFALWHASIAVLAACAVLAVALWLRAVHHDLPPAASIGTVALCAGAIAAAFSLVGRRPLSLRWDGQLWHLGPASSQGHEPWAGCLAVAVDLGDWMLLRFVREGRVGSAATVWIGAQRRGLEHEWHALRCAVYSPRPENGEPLLLNSSPRASTRPHPPE